MQDPQKGKILDRRVYHMGEKIFREGDEGDYAYLVESGTIAIIKDIDGEDTEIARMTKGHIFGEMAVIDQSRRMASARVVEDAVLVRLSKKNFESKISKVDSFVKAIINVLLRNLRSVHLVYMKRPRSFRDFARVAHSCADNMVQQCDHVEHPDGPMVLEQKVDAMRQAIDEVLEETAKIKDRRTAVVSGDDLKSPYKPGEAPPKQSGT